MALSVRRQPRYKFAAPVLSPSCLQKLCVPWEFAARLAAGAGDVQEVHVVDLLGKPRRVELCTRSRPDGGVSYWLGAGWPDIVKKNGIGEGWSVVLRRERRGMATLSAYDPACCLACLCTPPAGVTSKTRPRFIKLLRPNDWEKMVFLPNGCMKEYPYLADEADAPSPVLPESDKQLVAACVSKRSYNKRQVVSAIPSTFPAMKAKKAVKLTFCSSIGLLEACTIQLKTSMEGSAGSWPVAFNIANTYGFLAGKGWKKFCRDNEVEEGDRCTFKVVEKMVWHVVIN